MLKVGDIAPSFRLKDQFGEEVELARFKGRNPVVLYFYPKDHTPGCIKEACSFRDEFSHLLNLNAVVFGINQDAVSTRLSFSDKYNIPFQLLSDEHGNVTSSYVARGLLGLTLRITYVIDMEGRVALAFRNSFRPKRHVEAVLKQLNSDQSGFSTK
jgi:peroxiredoxin Q/BCP